MMRGMTGKTHSEETKAKMRASWTPERRAKRSKSMMGKNNPMNRPKVRAKIIGENNSMYGKFHSEAAKAKMSAAAIEYYNDPENRVKHKEAMKRPEVIAKISGENNPSWQGGKSFEPYGLDFNDELKRQIRARDNHTCQECRRTEEQLNRALDVHHIDYDKQNNSPENLIGLCAKCHRQTNYQREDWTEYFGIIMEVA